MVPFCLHGGNPLAFFDINENVKRIRSEYHKGGMFEALIDKYILSNKHRLRLTSSPNAKLAERAM